MSASPRDIEEWRAQFEKLGASNVRMLQPQWSGPIARAALDWLAGKDHEERRLSEASQEEQIEIARSAANAASVAAAAAERAATAAERQANAAEKANTRATIALVIAVVSIIATVIGIAVTHFDALK